MWEKATQLLIAVRSSPSPEEHTNTSDCEWLVCCHSLETLDSTGCRAENAKERKECSQNPRQAFHWQLKDTDGLFIMYMQNVGNTKGSSKEVKLKSKSQPQTLLLLYLRASSKQCYPEAMDPLFLVSKNRLGHQCQLHFCAIKKLMACMWTKLLMTDSDSVRNCNHLMWHLTMCLAVLNKAPKNCLSAAIL